MSRVSCLVAALLWSGAENAALAQDDRRQRTTPGLILETGARTAACDVLAFTTDGLELLATGDDKVVRVWPVTPAGLDAANVRVLRWPIYREQRGSIFALALSPDAEQSHIAVAGYGLKTGSVAIVNRHTGAVEQALDEPGAALVNWAIVFVPGDTRQRVVFGNDQGDLWLWEPGKKAQPLARNSAKERSAYEINRVRSLRFLDNSHCQAVTMDGAIRDWDIHQPSRAPELHGQLETRNAFRVAVSTDGWLAAIGEIRGAGEGGHLRGKVELLSTDGRRQWLKLPEDDQLPYCVAFSADGATLAVGARLVPRTAFYQESHGAIWLFQRDGAGWSATPRKGPAVNYRPERLAFHPIDAHRLACAGGNDHEVTLWDLRQPVTPVSVARGSGSCLWSVAFSADGQQVGFQDRRADIAPHPNQRGTGAWRVFDLKERRLFPSEFVSFRPVPPLATIEGWRLEFSPIDGRLWILVAPDGRRFPLDRASGLFNDAIHELPRCYAFLPATDEKPPRLALGHHFGVSVYELNTEGPRLVRVMHGHDGDVMGLAVAPNQKTLVTASRDQTICGWSLTDWEGQSELGADFIEKNSKPVVRKVAPGSPAWEVGLEPGDVIEMLVIREDGFLFDPDNRGLQRYGFQMAVRERGTVDRALEKLDTPKPAREIIFVWSRIGREQRELTTVRQRPLWRLFPTRADQGNEWALWRWRDFYYDTNSPQADALVGWHVNDERMDRTPAFHRLGQFRDVYFRPDKVQEALRGFVREPDRVQIAQVEPPAVSVNVKAAPQENADLQLTVVVRPRGNHPLQRLQADGVKIWVNDYLLPVVLPVRIGEVQSESVAVASSALRRGINHVTVQGFTVAGSRGEAMVTVPFWPGGRPERSTLFGLAVGISDYSGSAEAKGGTDLNLPAAVPDATALLKLWQGQRGTRLFADVRLAPLLADRRAAPQAILAELERLTVGVRPDDWLLVSLCGHGWAGPRNGVNYAAGVIPGSYAFAGPSYDPARIDETGLTAVALHAALRRINCNKMVFLDTCHSGGEASEFNQARALRPHDKGAIVLAACGSRERSVDLPAERARPGGEARGFFTTAVCEALGSRFESADRDHDGLLIPEELYEYVARRVPELIASAGLRFVQSPQMSPRPSDPLPLAAAQPRGQ